MDVNYRQKKAGQSTWLDYPALTPPQETMLATWREMISAVSSYKAGVRDAQVQITVADVG